MLGVRSYCDERAKVRRSKLTTEELNKLANMTSSPEEMNILINLLLLQIQSQGLFLSDRKNAEADRAVVLKDDGSLELTNDLWMEFCNYYFYLVYQIKC